MDCLPYDVTIQNGDVRSYLFDAANFQLLKWEGQRKYEGKEIPVNSFFSDYRDVGGVKFPFKYTFSWLDGKDAFQLTEVKTNVPIDPNGFGRPRQATRR